MLGNSISYDDCHRQCNEDVPSESRSLLRRSFDQFIDAESCDEILSTFRSLQAAAAAENDGQFHCLYDQLRACTYGNRKFKVGLWSILDARRARAEYQNAQQYAQCDVTVIGAGPAGLRTAIEMALVGVGTVHVLEKRTYFARNNVMRLWPYSIEDCKSLGAKFFYRAFCAGSTHHIAIWRMQNILLKIALMFGVQVHTGVSFSGVTSRTEGPVRGWEVETEPRLDMPRVTQVLIGADGEHSRVADACGFERRQFQAKRAIGLTFNCVHGRRRVDSSEREFDRSMGVATEWPFFNRLKQNGVELENVVYYRGETHYLVCTPLKECLLEQGVLKEDFAALPELLHPSNVDRAKLEEFSSSVARLCNVPSELKLNSKGVPDTQLFDFTKKLEALFPCQLLTADRCDPLLCVLVGDALSGPFWPQGTGANKAVLSALDATWMVTEWSKNGGSASEDEEFFRTVHRAFKCLKSISSRSTHPFCNKGSLHPELRYAFFSRVMASGCFQRHSYTSPSKHPGEGSEIATVSAA